MERYSQLRRRCQLGATAIAITLVALFNSTVVQASEGSQPVLSATTKFPLLASNPVIPCWRVNTAAWVGGVRSSQATPLIFVLFPLTM